MRTTLNLDSSLMREAKLLAAETGRTLTAVVEEALRENLARTSRVEDSGRPELPTFAGGQLLPGVDLDDTDALLDLMEGE